MHKFLTASLALALAAPFGAMADTPSDIQALRQEIEAMRATYEARLQTLEQRLQAAEAASAAPASAAPPAVPAVISAAAAPHPSAASPVVASSGGGTNSFNPAIALILSGLYTRTSQDPSKYAITGFPLPSSVAVGPGTRGFSLSESELDLSASIDPWLRGAANISLHPDDKVSVEEAFVQTTALGEGFSLKAGRFFSSVGYLNAQHAHTWDFVDNPLAYQALLGTQYGDDGLQLNWLAPTDQYIELGAEIGRGRSFPGSDTGRNGAGMFALVAHTGGDVGDSSSWRAGLSVLTARADDQGLSATDAAGDTVTGAFSGRTRVWVADAVWKWAPHGNATRTNFKLQGEYLRSTRSGSSRVDPADANGVAGFGAIQSGWYVQGVYQFMPRWRVGLRTERLNPGRPAVGSDEASPGVGEYHPYRNTLMVDFSPSEFSRVRLQLAQDRARQGFIDHQLFVQYQMSLGAHGAHNY